MILLWLPYLNTSTIFTTFNAAREVILSTPNVLISRLDIMEHIFFVMIGKKNIKFGVNSCGAKAAKDYL